MTFLVNENRGTDSKVILRNASFHSETSLGKNGFQIQIITVRKEEMIILNFFPSAVISSLRIERYNYIYLSVEVCGSCYSIT
jgi:hypothetical protein